TSCRSTDARLDTLRRREPSGPRSDRLETSCATPMRSGYAVQMIGLRLTALTAAAGLLPYLFACGGAAPSPTAAPLDAPTAEPMPAMVPTASGGTGEEGARLREGDRRARGRARRTPSRRVRGEARLDREDPAGSDGRIFRTARPVVGMPAES